MEVKIFPMQGGRAMGLQFFGLDGSDTAGSLGIRVIAACCQDAGMDWVVLGLPDYIVEVMEDWKQRWTLFENVV